MRCKSAIKKKKSVSCDWHLLAYHLVSFPAFFAGDPNVYFECCSEKEGQKSRIWLLLSNISWCESICKSLSKQESEEKVQEYEASECILSVILIEEEMFASINCLSNTLLSPPFYSSFLIHVYMVYLGP